MLRAIAPKKSQGGTIKVLDFIHFVICLRDPWVELAVKISVSYLLRLPKYSNLKKCRPKFCRPGF